MSKKYTHELTKKTRWGARIWGFLSFLANFGPVIGFFIYGLIMGGPKTTYSMSLIGIVGIIVGLVSVILKKHWRTPLIIMLGGLYFAVNHFAIVLVSVAICIVLDEIMFEPLHKYYKTRLTINKEIDRRV